jgi:pyridoxal phosphate enzyme (YggS family)
MSIAENLAKVRERIAAAARHAGRNPDEIALMAVTKMVEPARIQQAYNAGLRLFGENRVQEFAEKAGAVKTFADCDWHLIGHLQTNKANKAAEIFEGVDSIDSLRLAEKLNAAAARLKRKLPVLIEINIGGEEAKTGISPDSVELEGILGAASKLSFLDIVGLMTIPPFTENPNDARPYFRKMRQLRETIAARHFSDVSMRVLSMGMSHDFEVAIEEGSTCVRIGTLIFGERPKL